MTPLANILADVSDALELVAVLAIVVVSLLARSLSAARKKAEARRADQARQERAAAALQQRTGAPPPVQPPSRPQPVMAYPAPPQVRGPAPTARQARPAGPTRQATTGQTQPGLRRRTPEPARPLETAPLPALKLDLANMTEARRAIVTLEVLSRPKALRRGPEIWDL